MQTQWFRKAKSPQQRDEIKQIVLGSQKALDILAEICYNTIQESESRRISDDYDSPSWAHKQADLNGYIRAYKEMSRLLNVSDKDH
jgi:hypothetical protein